MASERSLERNRDHRHDRAQDDHAEPDSTRGYRPVCQERVIVGQGRCGCSAGGRGGGADACDGAWGGERSDGCAGARCGGGGCGGDGSDRERGKGRSDRIAQLVEF